MKKYYRLIMCLLLALLLSSCAGPPRGEELPSGVSSSEPPVSGSPALEPPTQEIITLNPSSNIKNGSIVCASGNRIYYTGVLGRGLYSSFADGSDAKSLAQTPDDIESSEHNVVIDGQIYSYLHDYSFTQIVRRKLDGSGKEELKIKPVGAMPDDGSMMFDDQYIYYPISDSTTGEMESSGGGRKIGGETWRMTKDGKDHQKIFDQKFIDYVVQDGWIYFCDYEKEYRLYKMKTDGTEITQLDDRKCARIQADGEWVYYTTSGITGEDNYMLSRIKKDGTGRMDIRIVHFFNVSGGVIYFTDADQNANLYRMDADGTEPQRILSFEDVKKVTESETYRMNDLNVLGDRVYFTAGCQLKAGDEDKDGSRRLIFYSTIDGTDAGMVEKELFEQKKKDGTLWQKGSGMFR